MQQLFLRSATHIVRQRVYVIDDAIIYSKRSLLRLRPLPSNNELSAEKAHWKRSQFIVKSITPAEEESVLLFFIKHDVAFS